MIVLIKHRDGVSQRTHINPANFEVLKKKYGDMMVGEPQLRILIKRFVCISCGSTLPIIEEFNNKICWCCRYGSKMESY